MKIIDNVSAWPTPTTWRVHRWPDWVPASVAVQVEDIWPTPTEWRANCAAVQALPLGAPESIILDGTRIHGRYVHVRNTIGRLVDHTGRVHVVERADDGHLYARRAS